jgi:dihydrolipoamide dehydrogenase
MKHTDVIIVGTGTAALAAASEVRKVTDRFIIVSNGVYGTTCVRAGCMPSKVFIHGAQLFHARRRMTAFGITGSEHLNMDKAALLTHVRQLRNHFLEHTLATTENFRAHIIEGEAFFLAPTEIRVNEEVYSAKRVVLATGSSPIIPDCCEKYAGTILTSDTLFEQEDLPDTLRVMGLSVLGTELAQAFACLGIRVIGSHENAMIGGVTDPKVHEYAMNSLAGEMEIRLNQTPEQCLEASGRDTVVVTQGRKANLEHMGLEECGVIAAESPVINYNPETMRVKNLPVFIAGDVKLGRSILNEAIDEGKIAGYNAAHEEIKPFKRRTPLQITYTEPTIAVAGKAWEEIDPNQVVIGEATYDDQGRAKIMGEASGIVRLYADSTSKELLGAELFAPGGEHLAHMLAWLIDRRVTVFEALTLPFYHPALEEGLRAALENATRH